MYIRCRLTPCGIYIFINTDMSVYIYVGNVYISMCKQPIEYRFASIMRSIFRLMIDSHLEYQQFNFFYLLLSGH